MSCIGLVKCIHIHVFSCCGYVVTAFVHAALPHKNISLRLCRETKTEKLHFDTNPLLCVVCRSTKNTIVHIVSNGTKYVRWCSVSHYIKRDYRQKIYF
jgi:hypothetical protein